MIDQRLLSIQSDPQQLRSISDFTDSLVRELQNVKGSKPSKALMRELLSPGVQRTLNIGPAEGKKRFIDALHGQIHKFILQDQQSLAKVFPVEISDDYSFLSAFGGYGNEADAKDDDDDEVLIVAEKPPTAPPQALVVVAPVLSVGCPVSHATLEDLRRRLAALPVVVGPHADDLLRRLLDEDLQRAVRDSDEKNRAAFFGDLRLNLFKLSEPAQRTLLERFAGLKADVVRLVESMTQEVSKWLDEEKVASQRGNVTPLLTKLKSLFKATLSVPFLATFKHLDVNEKKGKEAFLLKVALCLRTCKEKHFAELPELCEQVTELRKQFFYVEGYGELMEDWLNSRITQFNEDFEQRASSVLVTNLSGVMARLRRTFKLGQWISILEGKFIDDMYQLFLDSAFPKHVLTSRALVKVLKKIASSSGCDFHIYGDIARLPPAAPSYHGASAQDAIDAHVIEVLQRVPPFPALRKVGSGLYQFGRVQVEFALLGNGNLVARTTNNEGGLSELSAEGFFGKRGPEEFPSAAVMAVQSSSQHPGGPPSTAIEMPGVLPAGAGISLPPSLPMSGAAPGIGGPPQGLAMMVSGTGPIMLDASPGFDAAPPPLGPGSLRAPRPMQQRFEPYPTFAPPQLAPQTPALAAPVQMQIAPRPGMPPPCFGIEDDEI